MLRGRKPDLGNIARGPWDDQTGPKSEHIAEARSLRPKLKKAESDVWDQVAPELIMLGRLKRHHVHALAEYCRVFIRKQRVERELQREGWTYETEGRNGFQLKTHPLSAQANELFRQWRSLCGEFGLSPASERGLTQREDSSGNEFQSLERSSAR